MSEFAPYILKQIVELRPWQQGDAGQAGDMIARNPSDHAEQWLVPAAFFETNYEALPLPPVVVPIDRKRFFDVARSRLFDGTLSQGQVDGMTAILDEWEARGLTNLSWLAYMLATALHETNATMQPVREAYWLSEEWRRVYLRYWPFYGRGLVQITWEENYFKMTNALQDKFPGIDLVNNPDDALKPDVSVAILFEGMTRGETGIGDFTNHSLDMYFNNLESDPVGARAIVNGTDKAQLIAGYYYDFMQALGA